jgi:glycerol-3-phosphate dehydrogenase (NAD(P)+)
MTSPASIVTVGLGAWGTALSERLARAGHTVVGLTRDRATQDAINRQQRSPLFPEVQLSPRLQALGFDTVFPQDAQVVLLTVPAQAVSQVLAEVVLPPQALVVSAIKGLCGNNQTVAEVLAGFGRSAVVLSGPSFAADVIAGLPVGLVAAAADASAVQRVQQIFADKALRIYGSSDVIGVELGGVLKNVIAIAAGMCTALGLGESARAGLITRGLAELARIAQAYGAEQRTLFGLSGLGDLLMTCSSEKSRNFRCGLLLGQGKSVSETMTILQSTVEGVGSAPKALSMAQAKSIDAPIIAGVCAVLSGQLSVHELVRVLLERPLKALE